MTTDQYGIFKQLLSRSGEQLEAPDPWLDRESVGTYSQCRIG